MEFELNKLVAKPSHYYSAPRREMLAFVPESAQHVLEIGCGEGGFGAELKRVRLASGRRIHVTGVELMEARAAVAQTRLDQVLRGDIESDALDLARAHFDCIVCNDVLEHLVAPWDVLRRLAEHLRPGGHVVASIPNVRYWGVVKGLLFDADWRYEGEGVLDATHLRFFTRKSIARMFTQCDYTVERLDGINVQVSGWKFEALNLLTAGRLNDIKFWQFAVVARVGQ
jgi:2-polyprenyl-3-methyl-5-hydroxy-6-metoxy-1,4-benzoquinol methylase